MKKYLACLALALFALTAYADIEGAPYIPEIDARFNALEQGNHFKNNCYPNGSCDGHWSKQYAQATYDFSKQTGAVNTYDLGVSIPKNAIETRTFIYSTTKPTTSAGGTLAFYCASSTSPDLLQPLAAGSFPAAGAVADGTQSGAASNFSVVPAKCDITAKIATGTLTAGKVTIFVEYMTHQ
jgi:hypothetical protein